MFLPFSRPVLSPDGFEIDGPVTPFGPLLLLILSTIVMDNRG